MPYKEVLRYSETERVIVNQVQKMMREGGAGTEVKEITLQIIREVVALKRFSFPKH